MRFKLGRLPRKFNPAIPHYSALIQRAVNLTPLPPTVSNATMESGWGMMLNDTLGDCTCAGMYHALQTWTLNVTGKMDTQPDSNVLKCYEEACGYQPGNTLTDNGGVEQDVLKYWINTGIPHGDNGRDKLIGQIEIDPRQLDDVRRGIFECGLVYIGFGVPRGFMDDKIPDVWQLPTGVNPKKVSIEGGHAIILTGYKPPITKMSYYGGIMRVPGTFELISWGQRYEMTTDFFGLTDEVYGLVSADYVANTGKTPANLTLDEVEAQMKYAVVNN